MDWNPDAIKTLIVFLSLVGSGLAWFLGWLVGGGHKAWLEHRAQLMREKALDAKIKASAVKPSTARDQMWEDKNLAAGWRAVLLQYDERIEICEKEIDRKAREITEVRSQLLTCEQNHIREKERGDRLEREMKQVNDRCSKLEEINEKYRAKLLRNGIDPYPSPIHKTYSPEEKKDG